MTDSVPLPIAVDSELYRFMCAEVNNSMEQVDYNAAHTELLNFMAALTAANELSPEQYAYCNVLSQRLYNLVNHRK